MEYDVVIIGSGPAGLTAGIYTARKELKTLILYRDLGQAATAKRVENWPGEEVTEGKVLVEKIVKHAKKLGCELKAADVTKISKTKDKLQVLTEKGTYDAKSVIIATGRLAKNLEIPGEKEFLGRGVAYCATCDAPFFKNKTVAVIGGGNMAFDSAYALSRVASKVYLIHRNEEFKADKKLVTEIKKIKNIEIITSATVEKITGEKIVKGITVKDAKGKTKEVKVDGVFISVGFVPPQNMLDGLKTDKGGYIIADETMSTNIEGVFSAGDITNVKYKQMIVAAGEGAKAGLSVYNYLKNKKFTVDY